MRSSVFWTIGSVCVASAVAVAPAIAQEHQGCFMVHPSGFLEDLARMCAVPVTPVVRTSLPVAPASSVVPTRLPSSDFVRSTRGNVSVPRPTVLQPAANPFISGGRRYSTGDSDDGSCRYASDRARDGSRCGGRASTVRPGGR